MADSTLYEPYFRKVLLNISPWHRPLWNITVYITHTISKNLHTILCKEGAEENEKKNIYIYIYKWIKIPYLQRKKLHTKSILYFLEYKHSYNKAKTKITNWNWPLLALMCWYITSNQSRCPSFLHVLMERGRLHCHWLRCFTVLILTGTNSPANYLILCSQDRLHSPFLIIPLFILPRV